jgi:hypothetical protein
VGEVCLGTDRAVRSFRVEVVELLEDTDSEGGGSEPVGLALEERRGGDEALAMIGKGVMDTD